MTVRFTENTTTEPLETTAPKQSSKRATRFALTVTTRAALIALAALLFMFIMLVLGWAPAAIVFSVIGAIAVLTAVTFGLVALFTLAW